MITVGTELGLLSVTVNTAVFPSMVVTFAIVTVGFASLSDIVPVALTAVFAVFVDVTVPVSVNVSVVSAVVSFVVGTLTVAVVAPAGIVTVMAVVV